MLLWTFIDKFQCGHILLFLVLNLEVELLDYMINLCWALMVIHLVTQRTDDRSSFSMPSPPALLPVVFTLAFLVSVGWYLIVVFICISLMTPDIELLFFVVIEHLEKCLFQPFTLIKLFVFLSLSYKDSVYILCTSPLSDVWFSPILGVVFPLFLLFFEMLKLLILKKYSAFIYIFLGCTLGIISKK